MRETRAFVCGCQGLVLTDEECRFLEEARPWGLIIFRRNIEAPAQVRALAASFRSCVGRPNAPVLIDQEGGRVQRFTPPHWPSYPAAAAYDSRLRAADGEPAARLAGRLIAYDLRDCGITIDCAPVLDTPVPGAHNVIGDRAFGTVPERVAALARSFAEGLLSGGVVPVIKHMPGHGRAGADTHFALPTVSASLAELEASDFVPFRRLADLPVAMTAHVIFAAIDPEQPATTSKRVIDTTVRGTLGFGGLLLTDDLSMEALKGSLGERASAAAAAGCDILLHCNGKLEEARAVAAAAPILAGASADRAARALAYVTPAAPALDGALRQRFDQLFAAA